MYGRPQITTCTNAVLYGCIACMVMELKVYNKLPLIWQEHLRMKEKMHNGHQIIQQYLLAIYKQLLIN